MTTRIPAHKRQALRIQVYTFEDFGEPKGLGGTLADLERLAKKYGPGEKIGTIIMLERAKGDRSCR